MVEMMPDNVPSFKIVFGYLFQRTDPNIAPRVHYRWTVRIGRRAHGLYLVNWMPPSPAALSTITQLPTAQYRIVRMRYRVEGRRCTFRFVGPVPPNVQEDQQPIPEFHDCFNPRAPLSATY